MKRSIGTSIIVGMGFGFPATLLCMALIGGFNPMLKEFAVWMVASALYGLVSVLVFNSKKEMAMPLAMVLHCAGCLIITVAAVFVCGYAESILSFLLGVLPVFVIVYAVITGVSLLMMKIEEKRINEKLNKA